jgi:hypothetical protein
LRPQHPGGHHNKEKRSGDADACPQVRQLQEAAKAEKDNDHEGEFHDPVSEGQKSAGVRVLAPLSDRDRGDGPGSHHP